VLAREDGAHLQIVVFLGVEENAEIEFAPAKALNLFGPGQVSHVSLERRLGLVQGCQKTEQPFDRQVQCTPDAELRPYAPGLAPFGDGAVKCREHVPRFLREDPARFRLGHHTTRTPEEGDTKLVFQLPDRLGERRLRDVESLSSATEVELFADREEVAQVP
jgi:hypothetical protein